MKTTLRKIVLLLVIILLLTPACAPSHTTSVACDVADLIDAIDDVNADAILDTLELAPGCIYLLTEAEITAQDQFGGTTFVYGDVGLPIIYTPVTINGHNATISRTEDAPDFRIFHITDSGDLTLNDLTITNGFASAATPDGLSAFPGSGGAIYNDGALLEVNRSTLQSNTADYYGGAIFNVSNATTYVKDSTISDNTAAHGGGIFVYHGGLLSVEGSNIIRNNALVEGGGINVGHGAELVVRNSVISLNHSNRRGGGIFKDGGADRLPTTISGSTFEGNTADWGGGGVFIWRTPLSIGTSQFLRNQADEYGGGLGYQNDSTETVIVRSSTFDGNTAGLDGGGIHFSGEMMNIINSNFLNNKAENGGAIHNAEAALSHYIIRADTMMSINQSAFKENIAITKGGGIFNRGTLTVDDGFISGNKSTGKGGGIYNLGKIVVQDSSFIRNNTGEGGGGLSTSGETTVTGSTFAGNSAVRGGGLDSLDGKTILDNDTFSDNSADDMGGGISLSSSPGTSGVIYASHITVAYNNATTGGGIAVNGGSMAIKNSIVAHSLSGGDCYSSGGSFAGVAENIDTDGSCPGFTIKVDPLLDVLANYGGSTHTHALSVDSPAINAAPDCTTIAGAVVSVDQRAHTRPIGPFCDLGAYEYDQVIPAPAPKTQTFTPTPEQTRATAKQNTNCRYGPGTAYDIADTLFEGQTAPIVGRNQENTWWQIKGPTFGSLCWVSHITVEVTGPTDGVPIGKAPPPPTLTPEPDKQQDKPRGCYVYDNEKNPVCTVPCPPNARPGGACTP